MLSLAGGARVRRRARELILHPHTLALRGVALALELLASVLPLPLLA
jgi:hypothetical protein